MAEAVYAALEYFGTALGTEMTLTAGQLYGISQAIVAVASVYTLREQQRRQQGAARDAYNASLRDRYVMVRGATEQRQIVLGRQRVSGPIGFVQSYGNDREKLVFTLILAAHECDAIEDIYLDDERVTLDGSGNVLAVNRKDQFTITTAGATFTLSSAPAAGTVAAVVAYGTTQVTLGVSVSGSNVTVSGATAGQVGTVTITYQPAVSPYVVSGAGSDLQQTLVLDSSGAGSVTLSGTPVAGSVNVTFVSYSWNEYNQSGMPNADLTSASTVAGSVVSVAAGGGYAGQTVTVSYRTAGAISRMRIRKYLGAPGQAADAAMIAALPGVWTSAHVMAGLTYLAVECDYEPDAFPSGLPNISAVVRGAKLYDPRTGATVWSENPALMMRYVATSPLLGKQAAGTVNDTSIAAAANTCDGSASYIVNGQTYARQLYTAGLVLKSGTRPKDALDDLALAMAGRWCFIDGQLRVRAGAYATPLQTLTDAWLAGTQPIQISRPNRQDVFNIVAGKFVDEQRDYQALDYPRVASSAYITEDGADLPMDVQLNAVTFTGQAQQVVAAMMRDARQGLRVTLTCNMRAYPVEVFDVLNVTLDRFGWTNKPFEVMDVSWTLDGGIQLQLKETSSTTWALGTSFAAQDPAPNTQLASPWYVPAVTGLAASSGTAQLLLASDGTLISRVRASWTAITDRHVVSGGGVEVRYGSSGQDESAWQTVVAQQGQSSVYLTGVRDGQVLLIKARSFNGLVRGPWSLPIVHVVLGKREAPSNVASLAWAAEDFGIRLTWPAVTDIDVSGYELRIDGSNWESATLLTQVSATNWLWRVQTVGARTVRIKAVDTTGNYSAAATTVSVSVSAPAAPTLSYALEGVNELLSWTRPVSGFAIDRYEIRYGSTWSGGTVVDSAKSASYRRKVDYVGARRYWVAAIDAAGNAGSAASIDVNVTTPGAVTSTRSEVVDNNALLYWQPPTTGSLPIDRYEVRKGSTWSGGTAVGSNGNSTFTAIFEQSAGSYSYWVAAIDSAGNVGTPVAISATINQPPDYVLRANYDDDFSGITLSGMYLDGGKVYGPALGETIQTHFDSRGWATPDDQIAAGYPLFFEPSGTSGYVERTMDYGAALPATIITVTPSTTTLSGAVTMTAQVSYKALAGDPWIDATAGALQVLASGFRYLKVRLTFTATGGDDLVELAGLNIKLSGKLRTDSGSGSAVSTDSGGTSVAFGVAFIDVDSITVTPSGTAARYAVYDFVDAPNPTGFKVLLFDSSGTRVSGAFSWTARGY